MTHSMGKVERIKTLRLAASNLRGAVERWAKTYADKSHYDKQAFGFTAANDRSRAFAVPAMMFEAYVGTYGNSSVGTAWTVDQGVITQYFAKALNIHKQTIFDTIAQLAEAEAASLLGQAQAELDALSAMLGEVAASVGTHPEGQDGEAGLVRSMGDAVGEAETPKPCSCHPDDRPNGPCREKYAASECQAHPSPITPNGA